MLAKYVESDQRSWDQQLPYTLFAYRCSVQASTQKTPFYLLYGCDPVLPIDAALTQLKSPYVTEPEDYPYELSIHLSHTGMGLSSTPHPTGSIETETLL